MFFVEARYQRDPSRVGAQVRYIAHREEGLTDGRRREIYGIGERYRALKGDEPAIRKAFREDGRGLRSPVYFRFILTVDNPTAAPPAVPRVCSPSTSMVGCIARLTLTCMRCSAPGSRTACRFTFHR